MSSSSPISWHWAAAVSASLRRDRTPGIRWHSASSPSSRCPTSLVKLRSDGPEKTKSTAATFFAITAPMGASQLAPPMATTTSGRDCFNRRATAKEAVLCENIEVKPTSE